MKTFGQAITAFLAFRADRKAPKTKLKHQWLAGCLRTLHSRPLADLTAPDLLKLLRQIEARGKRETATRVAIFTAQVYRHAIREGWCTLNPAGDLKGGLETPIVTNRVGYTDPEQVGRLMRLVDVDALLLAVDVDGGGDLLTVNVDVPVDGLLPVALLAGSVLVGAERRAALLRAGARRGHGDGAEQGEAQEHNDADERPRPHGAASGHRVTPLCSWQASHMPCG